MAYLGNQPSNNFVSLKRQVITGDGTTSYTLDHSVASVNDVAIFVNNVRQDPASYSISGTALTLGGTISSSDSCYVIFLGQALQTVTPDADTITTAMLKSNSVSSAKMFSSFKNGITLADQWRTSADANYNNNVVVSNNWERVDSAMWNAAYIGSPLTQSSGVFNIPVTGMYLINFNFKGFHPSTTFSFMEIDTEYDNGSGYATCSRVATENYNNGSSAPQNLSSSFMINASDSTRNFRFNFNTDNNGYTIEGNTSRSETGFQIIRVGDSV